MTKEREDLGIAMLSIYGHLDLEEISRMSSSLTGRSKRSTT